MVGFIAIAMTLDRQISIVGSFARRDSRMLIAMV
jgi:hypothetical protein